MRTSWKIGTVFGIGIYVHWTFLLLPLFALFRGGLGGEGSNLAVAAFNVGLVLAVMACVVLHEYGHALMARRFGIATRDITLYPIGGVARLEGMGSNPTQELWIALAGPAVNVAIAALLLIPTGALLVLYGWKLPLLGVFLLALLISNVVLVVFNMIPAFPMDGGRVLRALLSLSYGRLRATEIAAKVTLVLVPFFFVGAIAWSPMLFVVALFLLFAGQQELAVLRQREYLRRAEPIDVLPGNQGETVEASPMGAPSQFSGFTWDQRMQVWIMWRDGRPVASYSVPTE
jgi:Zn-dependent protease